MKKFRFGTLTIALFLLSIVNAYSQEDSSLRINGYMTCAHSKSSTEIEYDYGITEQSSFDNLSRYGIQFLYEVNADLDATIQIVGRGSNEYDPETDWAYLNYRLTEGLAAKMGKIRLPFYLFSDSIEVGYTYPWITPPISIYRDERNNVYSMANISGIDISHNTEIGENYNLTAQLVGGSNAKEAPLTNPVTGESGSIENNLDNLMGLNLSFGSDTWMIKLTLLNGKTSLQPSSTSLLAPYSNDQMKDLDTVWQDAAFKYDNGSLLLLMESILFKYDTDKFFPINISGNYATIGYRFMQRFLPHVTWSEYEFKADTTHPQLGFNIPYGTKETSSIVGLRTEIGEAISLKIEYHTIEVKEYNFDGLFAADPEEPVYLYIVGVDAVF